MRHFIRTLTAIVAFAIAPSAAASGPNPGVLEGGGGVTAAGANVRYVAFPNGVATVVAAVGERDGRALRYGSLVGTWGVPAVTLHGDAGGLSRDGRMLVLAQPNTRNTPLRSETQLAVLDTRTLTLRQLVRLHGDFSFDALAPDGQTLYLIEHVSAQDATRYRVRAYDLLQGRLLQRVIADKRQRDWVMAGYPVGRVTTRNGHWVYTLYQRPGGYPFVHALDAVHGKAVCVGLPWPVLESQDPLSNGSMRLDPSERKLTIDGTNGQRYVLDTKTLRVARPQAQGSSASMFGGVGTAVVVLSVLAVVFRRRIAGIARKPT